MAENIATKMKVLTKKVLGVLPTKAQNVVSKRFGLGELPKRMTLESIGNEYGITRERVRQIEASALDTIKTSTVFRDIEPILHDLAERLQAFSRGLVHEQEFLSHLAPEPVVRNHIRFYLVLGEPFVYLKEDDDFHARWTGDTAFAEGVHAAIHALCTSLNEDDLLTEEEMLSRFWMHVKNHVRNCKQDTEMLRRWLTLAKGIKKNPLGDWGKAHAPNIKIRGMRDMAFLVLRKHGKPLHFSDVAGHIANHFGRPAHVATCHNELIKDARFVLVGRGLYGLTEWGYRRGTVRDIISAILAERGPLPKDRIIEQVTKERHVKESTISVNLQNSKYFRRDGQGRYTVAH